ncbi:hypothetical protein [Puniceibacterium confluentis]|uniref:hypothetical protein n=1 Tax=Puniceibacterium confluentis TaxID=1958944 RepID=UPI0011B7C283|nr:hypothetical protein [Puniceibacterium confluentis]
MSQILAKLQAVHSGRKMVPVHVPEYDMDLHFPPLTVADHERIRKGISPKDEHALMVSGLIHMARTADGSPVFERTPQIKAELHRMELHVLQRIMRQASGGISDAAAAEIGALDEEALRAALLSLAGEDAPILTAAVRAAEEGVLVGALAQMVEQYEAAQPVKNG